MATDYERLHDTFHGNITQGMYEWLAEQLGVSTNSLRELQVGWAPVLEFKGGKKGRGWFSVPYRDATGKVIGLGLRSRDGNKLVYPGTKYGCIYAVNRNHLRGSASYSYGAHNWVRTMDARELCPVCGKPDGCLLSAEDVANPKAVICRATVSPKRMKFGWLHIRKKDGDLSAETLLGGTNDVLMVEGMSDTAAAMDLGYTALGRPSDMSGQDVAAELVRGRRVVVVGENDQKMDGKWPGRDGMVAMYQTVKKFVPSAKMVLPPGKIKDLRAWVNNGLTQSIFEDYLIKHATEKVDANVLANDDPLTVSKAFLNDEYKKNRAYNLRRWEGSWYEYTESEGKYHTVKEADIRSALYLWSDGKYYQEEGAKDTKVERLVVTSGTWTNFAQAGEAHTLIKAPKIPVWINGATGPDPKDVVVFNNGLLDVPAYMENACAGIQETTPNFFNTTALPLAFNPAASCPTWLSFLASSLGDEEAKLLLLQEWFGYCLTPDISQQKLMYFRGESGSGKGTILRVLQSLVGPQQYASSSLSQLAESFGLSPLIGKLICVIGDARLSRNTDAMRGLEVLLGLTGGDAMSINRKFKDQLEGTQLTARITIASNDFLDVPDHSGAMLRRLNVIHFARSFKDNPDVNLADKLEAEIEGIAMWALAGLKRLRDQGRFTVPASSTEALSEWERDTNPMVSWLQDCTKQRTEMITKTDALYDCWTAWAKETRRAAWTRSIFLRRFAACAPWASNVGAGMKGIEITPYAGRRFLGMP